MRIKALKTCPTGPSSAGLTTGTTAPIERAPLFSERFIGLIMAVICALFWSVVAIALKYLLIVCHAETVIWSRFFFSFLALATVYAVRAPKAFVIFRRPPLLGILAGVALGFNYFGHTIGVHLTTPSNAQVLMQLGPLFLAVIGVVHFKERLTRIQKIGFLLALAGGVGFYSDQITHLVTSTGVHMAGDIWLLSGAVLWAVFAAAQKSLLRAWTPQQLNMVIYGAAALVFLPQAHYGDFLLLNGVQWAVLAFLVANTLIGYGALAEAMKRIPANQVGVIISLTPLLTIVASAIMAACQPSWFPPDAISFWGYAAAVIMVAGVALVIWHRR